MIEQGGKKNKIVSIIIPFRDQVGLLRACVSSILEKSTYENFELILVNNNSQEKRTVGYLSEISKNPKVKIIDYPEPFNFSAINNFAAQQAADEFLLFLNNDTEVISENLLEKMLEPLDDPRVGAVGAKLLYADGTIQHAGVKVGKNIATHQFLGMREEDLGENDTIQEVDAVTGACMMTRRDLFLKLGGFDEKNLPIAYNDVDYCLRLRERGFKIMWTPEARLFHYESTSRKSDISVFTKIFKRKRYKEFQNEQAYMRQRWHLQK